MPNSLNNNNIVNIKDFVLAKRSDVSPKIVSIDSICANKKRRKTDINDKKV